MKARQLLGLAGLVGFPVATYAGYPALAWATALLLPRPHVNDPTYKPFITVVIAAHNEATLIGAKVANTLKQRYPPNRIACIVVCDGCTDDTASAAHSAGDARLQVIEFPRQKGKLAAIRAAHSHASGEIIVLTDANAMLVSDALCHLVAPFADPTVAAVSGVKQVVGGPESLYWRYEFWIRSKESASGSIAGSDGALYAVRASAIDASACAGAADDLLISLRAAKAAGRLVLAPRAVSSEEPTSTVVESLLARSRTTSGALFALAGWPGLFKPWRDDLWWKLAGHKLLRIATPAVMLAGAAVLAGPPTASRVRTWIKVAVVGVAVVLPAARTDGRLRRICDLACYAAVANVAALAGLARFVARRPIDAWSPVRLSDSRAGGTPQRSLN